MKLYGCIVLEGTLTCRTGLHIGALVESFVVGETDSPFVREPYSREHYIPGASLRGKLRALLERYIYTQQGQPQAFFRSLQAGTKKIYVHSCGQLNCPICRLFGNTPIEEAEQQIPAAIHIEDLYRERPLPEPETKTENALDRTTQAANPRTLERVSKSTQFKLRMSYFIRDPNYLEEDLRNLQMSLALLQDDYLGGGGSRGSGAVTIVITSAKVMRVDSQYGISAIWHSKDDGTLQKLLNDSGGLAQRLRESPGASGSQVSAPSSDRQTWVVRLKFRTPLHIGEPGIGVEGSLTYIPSDTLFSALCHTWLAAFGEDELRKLLEEFLGVQAPDRSPPFVLSSAYPYWDEQFFLPKPYIPPRPYTEEPSPQMERTPIKDLDFIPAEIFIQWIGMGLPADAGGNLERTIKDLEEHPLYREALVARVRIDRVTHASDLYFCGLVSFPTEGGLYVLIEARSDLEAKLKTCFELLGELGVGGERAAGCGKFDVRDWRKIDSVQSLRTLVSGSGEPSAYCTLSLYHPSSKELEQIQQNPEQYVKGYAWALRGGWATLTGQGQPHKRQACRMFKEGSVFTFKPVGMLVNVGQGSTTIIYRSGLAFAVPVYRGDLT